jgi:hypothetical protein
MVAEGVLVVAATLTVAAISVDLAVVVLAARQLSMVAARVLGGRSFGGLSAARRFYYGRAGRPALRPHGFTASGNRIDNFDD